VNSAAASAGRSSSSARAASSSSRPGSRRRANSSREIRASLARLARGRAIAASRAARRQTFDVSARARPVGGAHEISTDASACSAAQRLAPQSARGERAAWLRCRCAARPAA
jgi:hypothetical protein